MPSNWSSTSKTTKGASPLARPEDRVSLSEGAKLADLSVGEYMDLLASRGVRSKVTVEEYREGLKSAKTLVKGRQPPTRPPLR